MTIDGPNTPPEPPELIVNDVVSDFDQRNRQQQLSEVAASSTASCNAP